MNVRLSPEHESWLAARVAVGQFASVEEAVARAIEELMSLAELPPGHDLAWCRPILAQAETSIARGEGVSGDEFLDELDRKLMTLR